jgi:hypothetical protein
LSASLAQANKLAYDSVMKYRLLILFLLPLAVQADDIYRSVDRDGNVTFTDEPDTKAELIELEELPTYEAAPLPILPIETAVPEEEPVEKVNKPKYKISITSPEQNQSIWAGGGILTATVSVQPELNSQRADKVQFKLDGKKVGEPQTGLTYSFENLDRGSHILAVSVVNNKGKILKTSKSVLFHVHRKSIAQNGQSSQPQPIATITRN